MDPWGCSSFTNKIASWLVEVGLLHPVTNAAHPEWIILGNEDELTPPGYVVSFAHFHERGFRTPVSNFFHELHHYKIELQNLNPNSIL
jgi:desulfoferrodoxin (superoxide reductase-like protein)